MKDQLKTKQQLVTEMAELRQRIAALEGLGTADRQTAAPALESQRRLFTLMSNLPGMAYRCSNDTQWTMQFVSEGCLPLTGYESADLAGNSRVAYGDLIHPEDRQFVWQEVQLAIAERRHFQMEYRIRTAQGLEKVVWEQGSPVLSGAGDLEALEGFIMDITARVRMEASLREVAARSRQLADMIELSSQPVGMGYPDGKLGIVNPAYCDLVGYRPDELRKMAWSRDLTPPEWQAVEARHLEELVRTRTPVRYEKEYFRKDGSRLPVELFVHLVCDADGLPQYFYAFVTDLTERKRAEEALRKAHDDLERRVAERTAELTRANEELALFRRFAESSGEGFGMSDFDGRIVYANAALCQLFGEAGPQEVIGKPVTAYYPPEYAEWRKTVLVPTLLREGRCQIELTIAPRHGQPLHAIHSAFLIRDEEGRPFRIAVVISDVTARKQAEEALRLSENSYRMLIDACPDAVVMADPQLRLVFASPQAVRLYGAACEEELHGRPLTDFVVPEERPRVIAGTPRFFERGVFHNNQYTFLRQDGSRFPCELSSAVIKDDQHQPVGVISIVRDITERKQAQDALERERQSLWQMLQASDHERQTISYEIHDGLAQYLAAAKMQLQVFDGLRQSAPAEAKKAYDAALQLVNQSHFEARRLISEVRPPVIDETGLEMAISHLVHEHRRHGGPQVECDSNVQFDRLPAILENSLYRIVQEALNNACQHGQSKKVKVSLSQEGQDVRLEVRDWGIGFDPESIEKGHFGLEGIRQRVRLLGGRLNIESTPGAGTLVQVVVPIVERKEEG